MWVWIWFSRSLFEWPFFNTLTSPATLPSSIRGRYEVLASQSYWELKGQTAWKTLSTVLDALNKENTSGKVSLSDHLYCMAVRSPVCRMGINWQSCFYSWWFVDFGKQEHFLFEIFCPLLWRDFLSDSWKHAFGLPVSLPDCQLREEKHNVSVNFEILRT